MNRHLIAAVAFAVLAGGWTWDSAHAATRTVYVVDKSTVVHLSDLQNALPAFQAAVSEDFAPIWGQDARLVLTTKPPKGAAWTITVEDFSDQPNALGYHDFDGRQIFGHVFVQTTLSYSETWQGVFTHELFEMLADPFIDRLVLGKKLWLVEVSDPVEADAFNYPRVAADGSLVPISDFVTPAWYSKKMRGPFDFAGHVKKRNQVLPGGYASWWTGSGWGQVFN